jgi:hypothetical protein
MQRVRRNSRELRLIHMDQCLVVAAFQIDVWLQINAVVDDKIETIALANRRDGAMNAIAK